MPRDYYVVLGIPADSTQREIKAAYRRLAKEFHPDRGSDRHTLFLSIQEAYSVLGDPRRRSEYDDSRRASSTHSAPRRNVFPSSPERVEPLIPEQPSDFGRVSSLRSHASTGDSLFGAWGYGGRQENLAVEVHLSWPEARRGGVVRLDMSGQFQCRACGGSGERGFLQACGQCGGAGVNNHTYTLRLEFPAGVPDNSVLRVPLDSFGRRDWLTVRFRVR